LIAAGLIMVAGFTTVLAYRFGAPLLLVFLGLGLLVGEDGLGIQFDDASLAYLIGSLALAVILFDSGFRTRFASFRVAALPAVTLATVGVVLTAGLVGLAARFIFGLPWLESLLMGAIISSTDVAAVFFLLRVGGISIRERVRATLEIESGANDPMGIFLTVALVELILADQSPGLAEFLLVFVKQMGLGLTFGLLGGFLIVRMANSIDLEPGLYPIVVLAASLAVFGGTGAIGGSGFLAAYVAGLYAGNQQIAAKLTLLRFQDAFTWLAQIGMFLVLGLLAMPSQFPTLALQAFGIALFLIFVARPLAVWLCLLPFNYQPDETAFIAWVGIRGAVSIVLAISATGRGHSKGQLFFNAAFIMVSLAAFAGLDHPADSEVAPASSSTEFGPVERVELDLPGTAHHGLSPMASLPTAPWLEGSGYHDGRAVSVVRDGRSMRYQYVGRIQPGPGLLSLRRAICAFT
jgi:cell volume regulation protein A